MEELNGYIVQQINMPKKQKKNQANVNVSVKIKY